MRWSVSSCGCANTYGADKRTTHGHTGLRYDGEKSKEYLSWQAMKARCSDPKNSNWQRYGGRGIGVCERWRDSFENFFADMGRRPTPDHELDRIDNNGGYEPGNCKWSTRLEQANNRSNTRLLAHRGETHSLAQWARLCNIDAKTLHGRLRTGWNIADALDTPISVAHSRRKR